MILGIGVDTVDIGRFERSLVRTPALSDRLFCAGEQTLPVASLAARFAAKEALMKALGGQQGLRWHDMEVVRDEHRAPSFVRTEGLEQVFLRLGADRVHLSLTHDGGVATAFVIVEAAPTKGEA